MFSNSDLLFLGWHYLLNQFSVFFGLVYFSFAVSDSDMAGLSVFVSCQYHLFDGALSEQTYCILAQSSWTIAPVAQNIGWIQKAGRIRSSHKYQYQCQFKLVNNTRVNALRRELQLRPKFMTTWKFMIKGPCHPRCLCTMVYPTHRFGSKCNTTIIIFNTAVINFTTAIII